MKTKLINFELNDFDTYKEYRVRCIGIMLLGKYYFSIKIYFGKRTY